MRKWPGVRRVTLRSNTRLTWPGRPISRFSQIASSKKMRPGDRLIEDLGERELGLPDGDLVSIARGAVARWKRMRQAAQPFAQQLIDLDRRQSIPQPLCQFGVGTRDLMPVIESLERHSPLGQLALEVLVTVDAELRVVGKVRAELQEQRPEILVHAIEIVVIDHGGGSVDPRIQFLPVLRASPAPFRAHHPRLLLRLADVEHALGPLEAPQVLLRGLVLALPLRESSPDRRPRARTNASMLRTNASVIGATAAVKAKSLLPMPAQVPDHRADGLQMRHVDAKVHPVLDPLHLEHHVIAQNIRHRSRYASRAPVVHGSSDPPSFELLYQGACP